MSTGSHLRRQVGRKTTKEGKHCPRVVICAGKWEGRLPERRALSTGSHLRRQVGRKTTKEGKHCPRVVICAGKWEERLPKEA